MNKNTVITNMLWRFAERCGVQGIKFIVTIILARLLTPDEYGTVALVTVFVAILEVFIYGGFPNALIQKKDASDLDFSTIFYCNLVSCLTMYSILYIVAPLIGDFYGNEALTTIVRVLGVQLIITGLFAVQTAYVQRAMQFKKYFYATFIGTLLSAVVGIGMVYSGFGVWSIVGQTLTATAVSTIVLWLVSDFKPRLLFSFAVLKELFSFAWKLLIANLVDNIYMNLRTLIIGKMYSTADLAYYNKGEDFPKLIVTNLKTTLDSVLFSSMSRMQEDLLRLKSMTRRSIKTTAYLVCPAMVGLIVCAEPLIEFLLTEEWLDSVPFMRLFCLSYAFMPMQTANQNAIKALGRSDIYMKLQITGKVVGIITILITMHFGVLAIAAGTVGVAIFEMIIKAAPNKQFINYGYAEQLKDILPSMLLAIFMGACVWPLQYLNLPLIAILAVQASAGAAIYFALSAALKFETFWMLWDLLLKIVGKVRKKA